MQIFLEQQNTQSLGVLMLQVMSGLRDTEHKNYFNTSKKIAHRIIMYVIMYRQAQFCYVLCEFSPDYKNS